MIGWECISKGGCGHPFLSIINKLSNNELI